MDKEGKNVSRARTVNIVNNQGDIKLLISGSDDEFIDSESVKDIEVEGVDIVELAQQKTFINGTSAIEGELLISKTEDVDCKIDEIGHFIVSGKNAENYEINENGELIYHY